MKQYIIFAGVNGAGKSTLYQTFPKYGQIPRINTDEILRTFGDWKRTEDMMKAGKIAVRELNRCLSAGMSLNQETTLCGKTILKTIEQAKAQGYFIELYYVGVDSVDLAKQKSVAERRGKMEAEKNLYAEQLRGRLYGLLDLQKKVEQQFGENGYNVFVFGSYLTMGYVEGESDIDIAIYTEDFELYKRLSLYLEEYFADKKIPSYIFYIDTSLIAPIYCAPLNTKVQFTDYFPDKLLKFKAQCQNKLDDNKARIAV